MPAQTYYAANREWGIHYFSPFNFGFFALLEHTQICMISVHILGIKFTSFGHRNLLDFLDPTQTINWPLKKKVLEGYYKSEVILKSMNSPLTTH